ncbi:MAG: RNA methyltransferase [Candidatus Wallbacteria bacterium]|nr:RNA methyltransferase [Candidatus Wallbacteria bacterium]
MLNAVLIHYPCLNRLGEKTATAAYPLDVQDMARSCATFGVSHLFVVHPEPRQREFLKRVVDFWGTKEAFEWNWNRHQAMSLVHIVPSLEDLLAGTPNALVVTTSASIRMEKVCTFSDLNEQVREEKRDVFLLFGTGHGLHDDAIRLSCVQLEPVTGQSDYNHLSVRSATAVILSRICQPQFSK